MAKSEVCHYHRYNGPGKMAGLVAWEGNEVNGVNEAEELMNLADETAGISSERLGRFARASGTKEEVDEVEAGLRDKGFKKQKPIYYRHDV